MLFIISDLHSERVKDLLSKEGIAFNTSVSANNLFAQTEAEYRVNEFNKTDLPAKLKEQLISIIADEFLVADDILDQEFINYITKTQENRIREQYQDYLRALDFITPRYQNIVDKGGNPAINHMISVSEKFLDTFYNSDYAVVALLHDVYEDGLATLEELQKEFNENIVNAIQILSHDKSDSYANYINRIANSQNEVAIQVKLSDLTNNMDLSRIPNHTENDTKRIEQKYKPAFEKLTETINHLKLLKRLKDITVKINQDTIVDEQTFLEISCVRQ